MPGWSATVDGTPAAISKAEVLFRAVRVGPGAHEVRFTYRTPFLRTGIAVSIVSWLAAAALVAWTKRSRRWSTPVVPT